MATSQQYSFKGWKFSIWLERNKDNIKLLLVAVGGIAVYYINSLPAPWNVLTSGIATVGGKLILDTLEFFMTTVKLD